MPGRHLILYDGDCGLCRRAIAWVRQRDGDTRFETVAFQHAPSPPMTPELRAACARAVHVITRAGVVLRAGRASLFVLRELGWRRLGMLLSVPPLIWLVELGYRIVAGNRPLFALVLFRNRVEPGLQPRRF